MITQTTRSESNSKVDRQKRYGEILYILHRNNRAMTAKEIAVEMYALGYTHNTDRNNAQPRLTELCAKHRVAVVGKCRCDYSGRTVSLYELSDEERKNVS